jgi:hypothetical protein
MTIIRTQRNMVRVFEPQPEHDMFVETLTCPNDGSNVYRTLFVQPIAHWQEALDWAVEIADQMKSPVIIAAIGGKSFLRRHEQRVQRALRGMNDQQRGEMRQVVIATCASVMRDCDDRQLRAECFDILVKLRVVNG